MKRKISTITLFAFFALSGSIFAQGNDPVLMKINGKPVLKSEFEYIYNKNNTNNSLDKKTLEEYVDLFVNFKLKVEEAKTQGIDTTKSFVSELSGYRTQLTKPYLTDSKVEEDVLVEAYNRSKEDIDVSHILIRIAQGATPADTLKAWNTALSALKRLQKEDFEKVAKAMSEDPSAEQNGGHLGYISAFRTVYPFETAAYNTPVGTLSKPVRSAFGYHIIKVNARRASQGEVLVAHIMKFTEKEISIHNDFPKIALDSISKLIEIKKTKTKPIYDSFAKRIASKNNISKTTLDSIVARIEMANRIVAKNKMAKNTIDSIAKCIAAGDDFGKLAATYSDDKGSAAKNGELPWFGTGRMVPEFENAAFALKKAGDISEPIQSQFGWHIIKLIDKKGLAPFDEIKADLERKVKRDERANRGQEAFTAKLRAAYNYQLNKPAITEMYSLVSEKVAIDSAFLAKSAKLSKALFTFATKSYTQADFVKYLTENPTSDKAIATELLNDKLKAYEDRELLAFEDTQLEKKYPDFRFLIQEYHDGILLFEVSNKEVWDKASKDTQGLETYFKAHKDVYTWEKPHYKGRVIYCKDKATLKAAKAIVKKSDIDSIDKYLPARLNDSIQYVKIEKGLFVQGENKVVDNFIFKVKEKPAITAEYPLVFVTGKMLKFTPEDYSDVRGLVTADYQEYLEKEWIAALRAKYPVEVNQEVLKTVKKN